MCSLGNATAERAAFDYLASLHFRPCSAKKTPLSIRPHDQTMAGMAHELTQLVRTFHHASLYGRTLVVERPPVCHLQRRADGRRAHLRGAAAVAHRRH